MVRLVLVALLVASVETPGRSQSTGPVPKPLAPAWRIGETAPPQSPFALPDGPESASEDGRKSGMFAGAEVSPKSRLGLGVFGLKRDKGALPPVTVYEVNTRPSRKPGVGFSLKF